MLKIGDFSRLAQVTVKTLHHYDDIGLLRPARTDDATSYRYYSLDQLPRLHRIMVLRGLGLSLGQIADVLEDDPTPEALRGMLTQKRTELRERIDADSARLARVGFHLDQLEAAADMGHLDIRTKEVEPIPRALTLRRVFATFELFHRAAREIDATLGARRVPLQEPLITISHAEEFRETGIDLEFVAPVGEGYSGDDLPLPTAGAMTLRRVPGIPRAATYIFEGRPTETQAGTVQLQRWLAAHGYRLASSVRAVHLRGPLQRLEYGTWLTEFQHPLMSE